MSIEQSPAPDMPIPQIAFRAIQNQKVKRHECDQSQYGCPVEALREALARESALLKEKEAMLQEQVNLRHESDHRLLNGMQLVVSLLSLQGRASKNSEVAEQLSAAANRVRAVERIHRRLHLNDGTQIVAFRKYLEDFCGDFSGMITAEEDSDQKILVDCDAISLPTTVAVPLTFIISELITNAIKYGNGCVHVAMKGTPAVGYTVAVANDGPALPEGFDPAASKGLGMKIIQSFVRQIGGHFSVDPGDANRGPRFMVKVA